MGERSQLQSHLSTIRLLQHQVATLLVYQDVLTTEPAIALVNLLAHLEQAAIAPTPMQHGLDCLHAYGQWFRALATQSCSWATHLLTEILWSANAFTQQAQRQDFVALPPALVAAAQHDLQALQALYQLDPQQMSQWVAAAAGLEVPLPAWELAAAPIATMDQAIIAMLHQSPNWADMVAELAQYHRHAGVGLFARYRAFRWQQGQLQGIPQPDAVRLTDLVGYDIPRQALIQNTEALLAGYSALHTLLYGSRGTGKSSLVKALLNEYGDRGLRLIEVSKAELADLATIVERLRDAPQRFIIFVDDLSFEEDDDAFKALKVVLEGHVTARPKNVVVYATSNRRHLIREFFGDRPRPSDADEIHSWDTVQEKLSFSDRFGLTLTFEPPDQTAYLEIVRHLAAIANIEIETSDLEFRALQWATRHNGRSGRTARQFVDALQAEWHLDKAP
ncbi:ATP-binding protein [Leptolyngbya sp. AN02str]|uniref:ATP-binding protein n=1 Tax=Leptolyngbya sp. AN02str TaxID=3423363 RepID=UPI003D310F62